MSRRSNAVPAYRHHKPSGKAVVTINDRDIYLGEFGSKESRDAYDRAIAEWLAGGRASVQRANHADFAVDEILAAFYEHARSYYRRPDSTLTSEFDNFRDATRPLERLYGRTPACEFGPLALKAVRQEMIRLGWARSYINKQVGRVKRVFRFATENEMVPASTYHALQAVAGLRAGRSDARETAPVTPVSDEIVQAVLPMLSRQVRAMIELQLLTGMRPGEVIRMRPVDIDTSGPLWLYKPAQHKTAHHGHVRTIYLGPKAQTIIRPFFVDRAVDRCLFSPADAVAERRALLSAARKTPMSCGNIPGSNRRRKPKRQPGDAYTVEAYHRAIQYACKKADLKAHAEARTVAAEVKLVPRWHPNQLRHNAATHLRKEFGLEAAQVILGHKTLLVTQVYAEKNVSAAQRIMAEVG